MRQFLQSILRKPILRASDRFASRPDRTRVFASLTAVQEAIIGGNGQKGLVMPFDNTSKIIIFSDQHKGARNGADDFAGNEPNYLAALNYYFKEGYTFISLGDCEELWENTLGSVKKHNKESFAVEGAFIPDNRLIKIFGNHDLYWGNDPLAGFELEAIYGSKLPVYEGLLLHTMINEQPLNIFCTHGHQGDKQSDGNWFSKFFISRIWAPLQAYLGINPNEPSNNDYKKSLHNEMMYEWSAVQKNTLLITGHTHQPVFRSLTHAERLEQQLQNAKRKNDEALEQQIAMAIMKINTCYAPGANADYDAVLPYYFNTGCCCFADGDITGIELAGGHIRLIKWHSNNNIPERIVLEESLLQDLANGA